MWSVEVFVFETNDVYVEMLNNFVCPIFLINNIMYISI